MSRRHRPRNAYPEGWSEHNVDMDWRTQRDADIAAQTINPDEDAQRLRVVNTALSAQLKNTTERAELAEYALQNPPVRHALRWGALYLLVGMIIGYGMRLATS